MTLLYNHSFISEDHKKREPLPPSKVNDLEEEQKIPIEKETVSEQKKTKTSAEIEGKKNSQLDKEQNIGLENVMHLFSEKVK